MLARAASTDTCKLCGKTSAEALFQIPNSWRTPRGAGGYHMQCYLMWAKDLWMDWLGFTTDLGDRTIEKYEQLLNALLEKRCGEDWGTDPFFPYVPYGDAAIKNRSGQDYSKSSISAIIQMWESERGFMTWCTDRPEVPLCITLDNTGMGFEFFAPAWQMWLAAKNPDMTPRVIRGIVTKAQLAGETQTDPFKIDIITPADLSESTIRSYRDAWRGPKGFITWFATMRQEAGIEAGWSKPTEVQVLIEEAPGFGKAIVSLFDDIDDDPHAWDGSKTKVAAEGRLDVLKAADESGIPFGDDVAEPVESHPDVEDPIKAVSIFRGPLEVGIPEKPLHLKAQAVPELEEALTISTPPTEGSPDETTLEDWRGKLTRTPGHPEPEEVFIPKTLGGVAPVTKSSVALTLLPVFLDECIVKGWISVKDLMKDPDLKHVQGLNTSEPYENIHQRFAALLVVKAYRKALGL